MLQREMANKVCACCILPTNCQYSPHSHFIWSTFSHDKDKYLSPSLPYLCSNQTITFGHHFHVLLYVSLRVSFILVLLRRWFNSFETHQHQYTLKSQMIWTLQILLFYTAEIRARSDWKNADTLRQRCNVAVFVSSDLLNIWLEIIHTYFVKRKHHCKKR